MSINVTVTGNPVCIGKRMLLSDLEQVKRHERERRKRLRLAQVRQQSKDISSRLLERAKKIARKELNRYENGKNSELKNMHNQKILDIQRKYQEGMEDIGLAHNSAISQPDVDKILNDKKLKDVSVLMQRGKEANQLLKTLARVDDPIAKQQEHLRQVREIEKKRSSMVSGLSKSSISKRKQGTRFASHLSTSSSTRGVVENRHGQRISSKKRKFRKRIDKISPVGIILKPNIDVVPKSHRSKFPVESQKDDLQSDKTKENVDDHDRNKEISNSGLIMKETPMDFNKKKNEKGKYNPDDYKRDISTSSSNSFTFVSDDSSYFSDVTSNHNIQTISKEKTPKSQTSSGRDKVLVYDYKNRQRGSYDRPMGLVQKIDIENEPDANEMARKASQTEMTLVTDEIEKETSQKMISQCRGHRAALREKIVNDYKSLIQNLNHLSREERKLKTANPQHFTQEQSIRKSKKLKGLLEESKQQQMDRCFKIAAAGNDNHDVGQEIPLVERIITIRSKNEEKESHQISSNDNAEGYSQIRQKEQILEMLKKVERQKKLLLEEFRDTSTTGMLSADVRDLLSNNRSSISQQISNGVISPEIGITRTDNKNNKNRAGKKSKKIGKVSEKASKKESFKDKAIQVESLKSDDKSNEIQENINRQSESLSESGVMEHVEPVITVITHDNKHSTSNSSDPGANIPAGKNERTRSTPQKQKLQKKRKSPKKSVFMKNTGTSIGKSNSISAAVSENSSPRRRKRPEKFENSLNEVVLVDSNTGTSSVHVNSVREPKMVNGKRGTILRQSTSTELASDDDFDTSTSYASLPVIHYNSSSFQDSSNNSNNITSILQLLDSPVVEVRKVRGISPVSTPDTPSPRIVRVPSNRRNSNKPGRFLKFGEIGESSQNTGENYNTENSLKPRGNNSERKTSDEKDENCNCKNPTCRIISQGMNELENDCLLNSISKNPEKYDELQNICAERIASLTSLIHRVRDEQRELDFSFLTPSDDTTMMKMPSPRPVRSDLHSVQQLVESIKAIHSQLAETLSQSQKIIIGSISPKHNDLKNTNDLSTLKMHEKSMKASQIGKNVKQDGEKSKVKVVRDERVNIDLDRFKQITFMAKDEKQTNILQSQKETVEELSREILEQSESSRMPVLLRPPELLSSPGMKKSKSKDQKAADESRLTNRESNLKMSCKTGSIPLMDDMKETAKPNVTPSDSRSRPPLSNLHIHYTLNLEEPCHELSTIIEFDTPNTENRSIKTVRNRSEKSRKALSLVNTKKRDGLNEIQTGRESLSSEEQQKSIMNRHSSLKNMKQIKLPQLDVNDFGKSSESLLIDHCAKNIGINLKFNASSAKREKGDIISEKITSSSSSSFSGLSGISEIVSSSISDEIHWASSPPEEIEDRLKKLGIGWAITTLRKTREACALSSSSSSDVTTDLSRIFSSLMASLKGDEAPSRINECIIPCPKLPDFSDVSSISIREISRSTGRAVLTKARTSTPNIQISNYSNKSSMTSSSTVVTGRDDSDSLNLPIFER